MSADLTASQYRTLAALCAATGGWKWVSIEGLDVNKSSIYALERRGFVAWNAYRQRARVTAAGWAACEDQS